MRPAQRRGAGRRSGRSAPFRRI